MFNGHVSPVGAISECTETTCVTDQWFSTSENIVIYCEPHLGIYK